MYLEAVLENYPTMVTYEYFDYCDSSTQTCDSAMLDRQEEMKFLIFDGCITPSWNPQAIGDLVSLDLNVKMYVKADPQRLFVWKTEYTKLISADISNCGTIVYDFDFPSEIFTTVDAYKT